MKALKNILLLVVISALAIGFSACEFKGKEYTPSDENLFVFTQLADGTYSVSAGEDVKLPETLNLPKEYNGAKVTQVADYGFKGFEGVVNLTIPGNIETIGVNAFYGMLTLENVHFYQGVKKISDGAFYGCSSLKNFQFASTTETIGDSAFSSCNKLTEVKLTEKVKTVGANAFAFNKNLRKVYISHSVYNIGEDAFAGCDKVEFECSPSNDNYHLVDGKPVKRTK